MSAAGHPTADAAGAPALKVTQARVLRSEWTKFRSLRSTVWTLLVALVLMIGIGALFSAVNASQYHTCSPAEPAHLRPGQRRAWPAPPSPSAGVRRARGAAA